LEIEMTRRYAIQGNYGSASTAHDVLRITAPTTSTMKLIELHVTQDTEEGSEMLPFSIYRASDNGVGSASNVAVLDSGDSAAGTLSAAHALSTPATKSPAAPLFRESQNILAGFHHVPVPEGRITVRAAGVIVCKLETAPSVALSLSVNAIVECEG
jgi:hypothetical protein